MDRLVRALLQLLLLVGGSAFAQPVVSYRIDVELVPDRHILKGRESVRWANTSSVPTSELWLHLGLNAYASNQTTLMRQLSVEPGFAWGWIRITSLHTADGSDLLPGLSLVQPDDGNRFDATVARLSLPAPVLPGAAVELEIEFEAQLPALTRGTGHAGDFHLVGHWFPRLGVLEDSGVRGRRDPAWVCHQEHRFGGGYADIASFRVAVTVPVGWVVGASGVEVHRGEVPADAPVSTRIVFRADSAPDFAWTAAPQELLTVVEAELDPARDVPQEWIEQSQQLLGRSAAELELPPIHLRLLIPRSKASLADRLLKVARLALVWHGLHYGVYPYPQLTIVVPPLLPGDIRSTGYPTLIAVRASMYDTQSLPFDGLPRLEAAIVHQVAHQYFNGMMASDQMRDAWLAEGLTRYAEISCLLALAKQGLLPLQQAGELWTRERDSLRRARAPVRPARPAWHARSRQEYTAAVVSRPALALRTLEGLVGQESLARGIRAYVTRFRHTHPTGEDLFAILDAFSGDELGWLFSEMILGDAEADWAVLDVSNQLRPEIHGKTITELGWDHEEADGAWQVEIDIGRHGELTGPVQVEMSLADGTSLRRTWDGQERWQRWRLRTEHPVVAVIADPDGVWALETQRHDNYWRSSTARFRQRPAWWFTHTLHLLRLLGLPVS
jgi:hypothetical protein